MVFNPNLAPLLYRNILSEDGGPIEKIALQKKPNRLHPYQAFAYLKNGLLNNLNISPQPFIFYGNQNGTGSGKNIAEATAKAISEALERWAFTESVALYSLEKWAFHIDSSTTGMAAFPGFFSYSAREFAKNEAVERWAIGTWWDGHLPLNELSIPAIENIRVFRIETPMETNRFIILLSTKTPPFAYGFAADYTLKRAIFRAHDELSRNLSVLQNKFLETTHSVSLNSIESNLIKWSTSEAHKIFLNKIKGSKNLKLKVKTPRVICDSEIKGPWSKYASVWRFLYEPISTSQLIGNKACEFLF